MRMVSRWAGSLALAGMLATAATPAMAQGSWGGRGPQSGWNGGGYGGGGWGGYRSGRGYRGHDRASGLGIFVGVAALVGAVAVIASSAAKDKKAAQARATQPNYDAPYADSRSYQGEASASAEDAAVDACALAARDEGSQDGAYAEVRDITGTRPFGGGFAVDGTVDQRDGYRGQGVQRRFSCTWKDGRVSDLILSRDTVALRDEGGASGS
ncbi:MAG: hypothetical protein ABW048_02990 [Sphingobium sp.]